MKNNAWFSFFKSSKTLQISNNYRYTGIDLFKKETLKEDLNHLSTLSLIR